jgi:hypothetical protein
MSTDVSEVRASSIIRALIALMKEAKRTSETSVDIQIRTRQYIPEDSELPLCVRLGYMGGHPFSDISVTKFMSRSDVG